MASGQLLSLQYHNTLCLSTQNLHKHCFYILLELTIFPPQTGNNAYAKVWVDKQRVLWYIWYWLIELPFPHYTRPWPERGKVGVSIDWCITRVHAKNYLPQIKKSSTSSSKMLYSTNSATRMTEEKFCIEFSALFDLSFIVLNAIIETHFPVACKTTWILFQYAIKAFSNRDAHNKC